MGLRWRSGDEGAGLGELQLLTTDGTDNIGIGTDTATNTAWGNCTSVRAQFPQVFAVVGFVFIRMVSV